ncbi:MAG: ABC transporter permease [Bacteroidales bacterium]|nr:ABC transporter permease [Bacteroidales bacterium]
MNFNSVFKKELENIIKDHSILLTVIVAPILYALFMGSVYLHKEIEKIPFAVVDNDQSHLSRDLTQKLSASPKIEVKEKLISLSEAEKALKDWEIQGFIVFPKGFEKEFLQNKKTNVSLFLNNTRLLPSNELNMAVNKIMLNEGTDLRIKHFQDEGITTPLAKKMASPIRPKIKAMYNTTNSYGNFLLPALFFIILQQTLLLGLGESISKDRESGFFQQVLQTDSEKILAYTTGKSIYYFLLYCAYIIFFSWVIFPLFSIPVKGHVFPIIITGSLFIISLVLYAVLVGTFIKKQAQTIEILAFTAYPLFLISGYSWPQSAMPVFLQLISNLIPTTPMLQAMNKLYIMGGSWNSIIPQIIHLLLIIAGTIIVLVLRFYYLKKTTKIN